jgi:hypothetical protein
MSDGSLTEPPGNFECLRRRLTLMRALPHGFQRGDHGARYVWGTARLWGSMRRMLPERNVDWERRRRRQPRPRSQIQNNDAKA